MLDPVTAKLKEETIHAILNFNASAQARPARVAAVG